MAKQELMLNQSANFNFTYNNKVYKIGISIEEGIIVLKEVVSEDNYKVLNFITLAEEEKEENRELRTRNK